MTSITATDNEVLAYLDGRKTMTVVPRGQSFSPCRFKVGQPIYVMEAWASADTIYQDYHSDPPGVIAYYADESAIQFDAEPIRKIPDYDLQSWNWDYLKKLSPARMPLWVSRITLTPTAIRLIRVQELILSQNDIMETGIIYDADYKVIGPCDADYGGLIENFSKAWNARYSKPRPIRRGGKIVGHNDYSWGANPYCWLIEHKTEVKK